MKKTIVVLGALLATACIADQKLAAAPVHGGGRRPRTRARRDVDLGGPGSCRAHDPCGRGRLRAEDVRQGRRQPAAVDPPGSDRRRALLGCDGRSGRAAGRRPRGAPPAAAQRGAPAHGRRSPRRRPAALGLGEGRAGGRRLWTSPTCSSTTSRCSPAPPRSCSCCSSSTRTIPARSLRIRRAQVTETMRAIRRWCCDAPAARRTPRDGRDRRVQRTLTSAFRRPRRGASVLAMAMTTIDLLERARNGSDEALGALVERCGPKLLALVRLRLGPVAAPRGGVARRPAVGAAQGGRRLRPLRRDGRRLADGMAGADRRERGPRPRRAPRASAARRRAPRQPRGEPRGGAAGQPRPLADEPRRLR